ncbi:MULTISPECIES: YppE family protein [unclassified Staphylococcus]|uniref:YppE family protein n=1 Tax=unclassified Staphylococcus TaxID=91994 RepID=UPI0021CE27A8|nr:MULTISPECIES: YppE family protein [unclassified Staphylococcus]UXR79235.1 YppE family protein [Staphylococcus sp. IVB6227]UXR83452.1 YppE family protein [Staphylococcus sp. IVB6214]
MAKTIWQQLLNDMSVIESKYILAREGQTFDFQTDVVPFTSIVDTHIHTMHETTNQFLIQRNRIESLMQTLSVACHDKRTSKQQFYNQVKTVKHDLLTIERQVGNQHV